MVYSPRLPGLEEGRGRHLGRGAAEGFIMFPPNDVR